MSDDYKSAWKNLVEETEVSTKQLLSEIQRLIAEGNVHKLVIRSEDDRVHLSIPLTAGAVAGGILALGAPWLAIIAAVAGLVTHVKIEVTRTPEAATATAPGAEANTPPPAQN